MYDQPSSFTQNTEMMTAPVRTAPRSCHGLYLPHFVRVFSTMPPIMGSFRASKIRATTMIAPTTISILLSVVFVNNMNVIKKLLNKKYKKSRPIVPSENISMFFVKGFFSSVLRRDITFGFFEIVSSIIISYMFDYINKNGYRQ